MWGFGGIFYIMPTNKQITFSTEEVSHRKSSHSLDYFGSTWGSSCGMWGDVFTKGDRPNDKQAIEGFLKHIEAIPEFENILEVFNNLPTVLENIDQVAPLLQAVTKVKKKLR